MKVRKARPLLFKGSDGKRYNFVVRRPTRARALSTLLNANQSVFPAQMNSVLRPLLLSVVVGLVFTTDLSWAINH